MPRVLITGGAGFVGANLAVGLASRHPDWGLVAFDNLHRRGSELNLPRLEDAGVPVYISDCTRLFEHTRRRPRRSAATILRDSSPGSRTTATWWGEHSGFGSREMAHLCQSR